MRSTKSLRTVNKHSLCRKSVHRVTVYVYTKTMVETKAEKDSLAQQLLVAANNNLELAIATLQAEYAKTSRLKHAAAAPAKGNTIARATNVTKTYKVGRQHINALNGVSLEIKEGEFVAITGTSGSGKSTLLHLLGGLDKPSSGTIEIAGQDLARLHDGKLSKFRNGTIGFIFQFFYLQPFLSLQTNIEVPAMFARKKRQIRRDQSSKLAGVVGLSDRLRHLPRELSGGQMQRAAIARALQNSPRILLADEPTGNLDRANALAIFDLFKKIRDDHGTTVIVVTHDLELASMADRSLHMSDGAMV